MAKVQKLSDIQQEIAFTEFDFYLRYEESFKNEIKNATMQPDVLAWNATLWKWWLQT